MILGTQADSRNYLTLLQTRAHGISWGSNQQEFECFHVASNICKVSDLSNEFEQLTVQPIFQQGQKRSQIKVREPSSTFSGWIVIGCIEADFGILQINAH